MAIRYRLDPFWLADEGSPGDEYLPGAAHIFHLIDESGSFDQLRHLTQIDVADLFSRETSTPSGPPGKSIR